MKSLTFDKLFLRQRIGENRARHEEIYKEALIGYQKAATKQLEEMIEKVKTNPQERVYFSLYHPINHLKDYDRVLMMFDQCTEQEIQLDQQEYSRYIQDDWEWSQTFLTSNAGYSGMASGVLLKSQ